MARREHNAPLFDMAHAGRSATVVGAAAFAHLHKHQCAVFVTQDEVNLAATATGGPIIARNELQPPGLQKTQGLLFCRIPHLLGGGASRS